MSGSKLKPVKTPRRPAKTGETYRGVRSQVIGVPTRFTRDQIEKAVEAAIAKNADAIAGGK